MEFRGIGAAILCFLFLGFPAVGRAQPKRAVVFDQTNLPLLGVQIESRADQIIQTTTTKSDGTFELGRGRQTDIVEAALEGFVTIGVARYAADRMVLVIQHASAVTKVVASALTLPRASMEHLGNTMTAPLAQRLPAPRLRIPQSLPLLPSVVRGDGLFRIGGTRPQVSALWIDGFDVTDPVALEELTNNPGVTFGGYMQVRW